MGKKAIGKKEDKNNKNNDYYKYPIYIREFNCWELMFNTLMDWPAKAAYGRENYKGSIPVSLDSLQIERLCKKRGIQDIIKALPGRSSERKPSDQYMTPFVYPEHKKLRCMNALISVDFTKEPTDETICRCGDLVVERGIPENLLGEKAEVISRLLKEFSESRKENLGKYNAWLGIDKEDSANPGLDEIEDEEKNVNVYGYEYGDEEGYEGGVADDLPDEYSGDELNENTPGMSDKTNKKMPQELKDSFKDLKKKFSNIIKVLKEERLKAALLEEIQLKEKLLKAEQLKEKQLKVKPLKEKLLIVEQLEEALLKEEPRQFLYLTGFDVETQDGVCNYVRYKRSGNKAKEGSCLFIWEPLYKEMMEWTWLGLDQKIDEKNEYDLTSMLAYESLVQSSIVNTVTIPRESILIIDSVESPKVPGNRRIMVEGEDGDVDLITEDEYSIRKGKEYQRKNKIWDGQALVDESVFVDAGYVKTYEQVEQGEGDNKEIKIIEKDNRHGMMLLRNSFFKACGFRTKIQAFYKEHGVKEVIDHFGRKMDASKVKMIITPDSLKLLKFAKDFFPKKKESEEKIYDHWLSKIDEEFGIVKTDKASHLGHGKYHEMAYQLLNTLPLSKEDIEKLLQKELDFIKLLKTNRAVFLYWMRNVNNSLRKKYCLYWMYRQNEEFGRTDGFKRFRNEEIQDYKKRLKRGKVKVQGDFYTLCSMPLEMLKYSVDRDRDKIEPHLGPKDVYIQGAGEKSEKIVLFRYPHLSSGSVCLMETINGEITKEYEKWFQFENCDGCNIVVISPWKSNIMVKLGGADFDSDTALCVREDVIVKAAEKLYSKEIKALSPDEEDGPPVAEVDTALLGNVKKYKYTPKDIAALDEELAKSNIGQISNDAQLFNSYFWDGYFSGKSDDYLKKVYNCILKLTALNELEIDRSKHSISLDVDEIRKKIRNTRDPLDTASTILKYKEVEDKEGEAAKMTDNILLPIFLYNEQSGKHKAKREEDEGLWNCPMDNISKVLGENKENAPRQERLSVEDFFDYSCPKNSRSPYQPHVKKITAIWKQYREERGKISRDKDLEKRRRENLTQETLLDDAALAAAYMEPKKATMCKLFKMAFEEEKDKISPKDSKLKKKKSQKDSKKKEKKESIPKYPEVVGKKWGDRYSYLGFLFDVGEKMKDKLGKGNVAHSCVRPDEKGEPCRLVYNPAGKGEIEIWGDTFDVE